MGRISVRLAVLTMHLQNPPHPSDGVFWYVFEHLADAVLADPGVFNSVTPPQRIVFAIGMLRQDVNAGGFESYFRYHGGDTALEAREGARIIGQPWESLVADACSQFGDKYPTRQAVRERAVDELLKRDHELFDRLDYRFYDDLEVGHPANSRLDVFIWDQATAFLE